MGAGSEIPNNTPEGEMQPAGVAYYRRILLENSSGTPETAYSESYILTPYGVRYTNSAGVEPKFEPGILVFRGDGRHAVVQVDDTNLLRLYNENVFSIPIVKVIIFNSQEGLRIVDITGEQDSIYTVSPENRKWHLLGAGRDKYAHSVCLGRDVEEIMDKLYSTAEIGSQSMNYNQN